MAISQRVLIIGAGPGGLATAMLLAKAGLEVTVPVTHQHPNVDWAKERARYRDAALRQLTRIGLPVDFSRRGESGRSPGRERQRQTFIKMNRILRTPLQWLAFACSGLAAVAAEPMVRLEPAPTYKLPADPDCNSPCFWSDGRLHLFTSNQRPSRSSGPDLESLGQPVPCVFEDGAKKLRWIEAVYLRADGLLFGLYHREEYLGECPDREFFTVPDIGLARSADEGRTWKDLGIVLQDLGVNRSCDTPNKFFAGGVGDPSWAIDRSQKHAYIFYSSYTDPGTNQGVQIARLALADLDAPVGRVWRWKAGNWNSPGIGGAGTPVVPARVSWSDPKADAFWGPSVHWNTYLETHVVLVNHASDANWTQEGVYVFFAHELSKPDSFTAPRKLQDGGEWYAQVIGDPDIRGTDSLAGKSARFFQRGTSRFRILFEKSPGPPKKTPG